MICANEDFFPHLHDYKNADKMRLKTSQFVRVRDFHSGFHKIFMPKVSPQSCAGTKDVLDGAT
jgi:hypothetical protein